MTGERRGAGAAGAGPRTTAARTGTAAALYLPGRPRTPRAGVTGTPARSCVRKKLRAEAADERILIDVAGAADEPHLGGFEFLDEAPELVVGAVA